MTIPATLALQQALLQALKTCEPLGTLLGAPRIYDAVPNRPTYPYVTLGPHMLRDFSSGDSQGKEHIVTISAYSRAPGFREVCLIAETIGACLGPGALTLDQHHLVLWRFDTAEIRRDADALTSRASLVFRAISEPINQGA